MLLSPKSSKYGPSVILSLRDSKPYFLVTLKAEIILDGVKKAVMKNKTYVDVIGTDWSLMSVDER